jgi:hypothetical protein
MFCQRESENLGYESFYNLSNQAIIPKLGKVAAIWIVKHFQTLMVSALIATISNFLIGGPSSKIFPQDQLWNCPQKQMADPVFTSRPFSCSGKVW